MTEEMLYELVMIFFQPSSKMTSEQGFVYCGPVFETPG